MPSFKAPKTVWLGRVLSAIPVLMFGMSAVMKLFPNPDMSQQMAKIGIPETLLMTIFVLELASVVFYAIPQTAVLGAILLTGYLGGAILTHLRVGDAVFLHIALGLLVWGGLYLREPRLRVLLPLRKNP